MVIKEILSSDHLGRFFVMKPNGERWNSYYKTIDALRPLFQKSEFIEVITGFYLNIAGDFDAVRITYFVNENNNERAVSVFKDYFKKTHLVEIKEHSFPNETVIARQYGGRKYEKDFRTYLNFYSQIGLELLQADPLQSKILFATYRWQVRKASYPFREHFEPTFMRLSQTYFSCSEEEKQYFFSLLEKWPNPPQVDWAHMMVNMILGCDWIWVFRDPNYLTPGMPLSIPEINKHVRRLGFEIPLDWRP